MTNTEQKIEEQLEGEKVKQYIIQICDDCYELKGEMCNNPWCYFMRMTMEEVGEYLDQLLIRPVVEGERERLGTTTTDIARQSKLELFEELELYTLLDLLEEAFHSTYDEQRRKRLSQIKDKLEAIKQ